MAGAPPTPPATYPTTWHVRPAIAGAQLGGGQFGDAQLQTGALGALPDLPFGELVDFLEARFPGQKGRVFTLALKMQGYVDDPAAFQSYYDEHQAVIDAYVQHIDFGAITEDAFADTGHYTLLFILGAGIAGGGLIAYLRRKTMSNE